MGAARVATRLLPDGTPLRNRLLAALPADLYSVVCKDIRMTKVEVGETLLESGVPVSHVYFPNSGVYSVTNEMRDGTLVEVATVGFEGMLGVNVFLGDMMGAGRSLHAGAEWHAAEDGGLSLPEADRRAGSVPGGGQPLCAGEHAADDAGHGLQRLARARAALLPVAAADARSRRWRRVPVEARIPGDHARRHEAARDKSDGRPAAGGIDLDALRAHQRARSQEARAVPRANATRSSPATSNASAPDFRLLPSRQRDHLRPPLQGGTNGGAQIVERHGLDQPLPDDLS